MPIEDDKNEVKDRFIMYLEQMIQVRCAQLCSCHLWALHWPTGRVVS